MDTKHVNEAIEARGINNLPQRITDESNGLTYTLHGDYYFPDIAIPEADRQPIGMWGIRRMEYLKKYRMGLLYAPHPLRGTMRAFAQG